MGEFGGRKKGGNTAIIISKMEEIIFKSSSLR